MTALYEQAPTSTVTVDEGEDVDMAITPDETPRLANGAERKVYELLLDQLGAGDLVVPGKRVTDHLKDHEIDFEQISITERINQLSDVLAARRWVPFDELFITDTTKGDLIIAFRDKVTADPA